MEKRKQKRPLNPLSGQLRARIWVLFLAACFIIPVGQALGSVSPEDAIDYLGERATVCGTDASATYATGSRGQPTFMNLDRPYPRHVFTALIWGNDRSRFPYPSESLQGNISASTVQSKSTMGQQKLPWRNRPKSGNNSSPNT